MNKGYYYDGGLWVVEQDHGFYNAKNRETGEYYGFLWAYQAIDYAQKENANYTTYEIEFLKSKAHKGTSVWYVAADNPQKAVEYLEQRLKALGHNHPIISRIGDC